MKFKRWRKVIQLNQLHNNARPINVVRIGIARWRDDAGTNTRKRKNVQFCIVTKGSAIFTCNKKEYHVPENSIFIQHLRKDCKHKTGPHGLLHKRWIEIDGATLPGWLQSLSLSKTYVLKPKNIQDLIQTHREMFANALKLENNIETNFRYTNELTLLSCKFLMQLDQSDKLPSEVQKMLNMFYKDCRAHISQIAIACKCHPRKLQRLCKKHLGQSPVDILRNIRLEKAQELLDETDLSMAEISEQLGFADQFTFAHHIKRNLGFSPSQYRKKSRFNM